MTLRKKLYKAGEKAISMLKYKGIEKKTNLAYDQKVNVLELRKAENLSRLDEIQAQIAKGNVSMIDEETDLIFDLEEIEKRIKILSDRRATLDTPAPKDDDEEDDDTDK